MAKIHLGTDKTMRKITMEECLKLHKADLQEKISIFIFDEFLGEAFTYISNTKNLLVLSCFCMFQLIQYLFIILEFLDHVAL